ncbi:MAG: nickel transporter permease [Veillonellaceae bacterium]|nr:nickel transporter permease [Veillonellaceae bacterium]
MRHIDTFGICSVLVGLCLFIAAISTWIAPDGAYTTNMAQALQAPSWQHWMGTDKLGRDVMARIIDGMRLSVFTALLIVLIMTTIGTLVGASAGWFGGWVEAVVMRCVDIMLAFPGVVLAIAIAGILGGSITNAVLALTVVGWAKYARMVRSLVLKIKHEEYMQAAIMQGAKTGVMLSRHILPNVIPLVIVTAALDIGTMMLEVAGLSFLGFGAQPQTAEWGLMINEGRQYLQVAPWLLAFPGAAVLIVVTIFNVWSDALRDKLDPRES